jgi:hypothetical protein
MDGTVFDTFECNFPLIRVMSKVTSKHHVRHPVALAHVVIHAPVMLVAAALLMNVATEARLVIGHACRILKCSGALNELIHCCK